MPMEIENLNGTRWTSTSARWSARAPYGGSGGRRGNLGDFPGGGRQIVSSVKPKEQKLLTVMNFITSKGPYDPLRMTRDLAAALAQSGFDVPPAKIRRYPLTWAIEFDAPNKLYTLRVVGKKAGPFENLEGDSTTGGAQEAQRLVQAAASQGTSIIFPEMVVPEGLDANALLDRLRNAKTKAADLSNATTSGDLRFQLTSRPFPVALVGGLGVLLWGLFQVATHGSHRAV